MLDQPRLVIKGFSQPVGKLDSALTTLIVAVEGSGINILCNVMITNDDYDRLKVAQRAWQEARKAMDEPQP